MSKSKIPNPDEYEFKLMSDKRHQEYMEKQRREHGLVVETLPGGSHRYRRIGQADQK